MYIEIKMFMGMECYGMEGITVLRLLVHLDEQDWVVIMPENSFFLSWIEHVIQYTVRFNVVYTLAYFCLYVIQHTWARLYKLSVRYISDLCVRLMYIHGRMFVQRLENGPVYWSVPTPPTSCSKWFTARQRTSYPLRTLWCWPTTSLASSHRKVSTLL